MIVWISGPTGAGKSTFAATLGKLGYAVLHEELPDSLFQAFTLDPVTHCLSVQEAIMRSRSDRWLQLTQKDRVAFDRTIAEDLNVFCRMHLELGFLRGDQFRMLQTIADELQIRMPPPDLTVYMSANTAVLTERIRRSSHPPFIVQNLDRQVALYLQWLSSRRDSVLQIDNSACSTDSMQRLICEHS